MKLTTIRILFMILQVVLVGQLYAFALSEICEPEWILIPVPKEYSGRSALMEACINKNPEVIRGLLEAGADVNARAEEGMTVLMYAARNNENFKVILILLNAGADAKAKDEKGKTSWDYAQDNEKLIGTDAYQKLKDATFK